MNMLLHGVENPDIRYRDSLAQDHAGRRRGLHAGPRQSALRRQPRLREHRQGSAAIVKTKKTELLFLALFLRLLKPGGRAAVIVPDGVLFGSSKAHKDAAADAGRGAEARRRGVAARAACSGPTPASRPRSCSSPRPTPAAPTRSGSTTSRPTAGASTTSARRCCPKTSSARCRRTALTAEEHAKNNLPDVLARWAAARRRRARAPAHRPELLRPQGRHRRPGLRPLASTATRKWSTRRSSTARRKEILADLAKLEEEIQQGMKELEGDAEVILSKLSIWLAHYPTRSAQMMSWQLLDSLRRPVTDSIVGPGHIRTRQQVASNVDDR